MLAHLIDLHRHVVKHSQKDLHLSYVKTVLFQQIFELVLSILLVLIQLLFLAC